MLVEVPDAEREHVGELVLDLMRHAAELDVALDVNVAWGTTWAAAKRWGAGASRRAQRSDAVTQSYFEAIADHLGSAYLRYSHTKGTVQEIDWLVPVLGLRAGDRVLDVGCGPGRHAHELAHRGLRVHGVDISETFVELARAGAPAGATFERADARELPVER
ncbi:MAG: methyltransferase domain-containing protein [Ilumatobacteraceae bacterium]